MTTAANNPKIITLEDLEEKLESFIYEFNDDLCRTIIEYMIDSGCLPNDSRLHGFTQTGYSGEYQ